MLFTNTTIRELEHAADTVGVRLIAVKTIGKRVKARLGLTGEIYRRLSSHDGHRVAAVCWHGHRDFFRALYAINPHVVITSRGLGGFTIRYNNAADFEREFPKTAYRNIGAIMRPAYACEYCTCEE